MTQPSAPPAQAIPRAARSWQWGCGIRWEYIAMGALALFGLVAGDAVGDKLTEIFIYAILALGLNVAVGYAGLLHLGIGAFFGIGAYIAGILTVGRFPFQVGFTPSLVLAVLGTAAAGLILGAPTLRLRGDYLALVTLGFGEVVKVVLKNLEDITAGMQSLNPLPAPIVPDQVAGFLRAIHFGTDFRTDYRLFFFLTLGILAVVVALLHNMENSRLGRAWVALREDELAASCMAINTTRIKLSAFALSAALAGLAGCLFATHLSTTSDPHSYGFNRSITVLCYLILGGLGSIRGVLVGVLLLGGYETILVPHLDQWAESLHTSFKFKDWNLLIFGMVLILMVRFRPEGLLPSRRVQHEMHPDKSPEAADRPHEPPPESPPVART